MEDAEAGEIRDRVVEKYHGIKKDIMRMQNVNNYRQFAETFEPAEAQLNETDVESLNEKFTRQVWNEKMDDLLPSVQRALATESSSETNELRRLAGMAATEVAEDDVEEAELAEANKNIIPNEDLIRLVNSEKAVYWNSDGFNKLPNDKFFYIPILDKDKKFLGVYKAHAVDSDQEYEYLDSMLKDISQEVELAEAARNLESFDWPDPEMEQHAENAIRHGMHAYDAYGHVYSMTADHRDWMEANKDELIAMFARYGLATESQVNEASPSVEKTIRDPNFVLVLKKDPAADRMIRTTKFTRADGLLSYIMSDIASRMIGNGADAVANFASEMSINIGDEGSSFGTKITPEYKKDKQLAMQLAKKYLDDIKLMATDPDYENTVRKDPKDVYGAKKTRSGGYHEAVDAFESWANEVFEATVGTTGTTGTTGTGATAARTNPQVVKALSGGDPAKAREIKRISDKLARGQKLSPAEQPLAGEIAKGVTTTKKPVAAMQALAQDKYTKISEDYAGASVEDIAGSIIWRMKRDKDLIKRVFEKVDIEQLMDAVYDVAEFHEGAEELGSSDISIMIKQVLGQLGLNEAVITEKTLKVKADADYDGDGEIESPEDEYICSKDKAIKRAKHKQVEGDEELMKESLDLLKRYAGL
jgi:hypothetical protein